MACGEQVVIPDGGVSSAHDDSVDVTVRVFPEREFFIDNLLVRVHLIIEMILEDRPCATGV